jgi:ABC-type uncharacterized transport system ATPase component
MWQLRMCAHTHALSSTAAEHLRHRSEHEVVAKQSLTNLIEGTNCHDGVSYGSEELAILHFTPIVLHITTCHQTHFTCRHKY